MLAARPQAGSPGDAPYDRVRSASPAMVTKWSPAPASSPAWPRAVRRRPLKRRRRLAPGRRDYMYQRARGHVPKPRSWLSLGLSFRPVLARQTPRRASPAPPTTVDMARPRVPPKLPHALHVANISTAIHAGDAQTILNTASALAHACSASHSGRSKKTVCIKKPGTASLRVWCGFI